MFFSAFYGEIWFIMNLINKIIYFLFIKFTKKSRRFIINFLKQCILLTLWYIFHVLSFFHFFLSSLPFVTDYGKNAYTHHYSCTWHSELFDIPHLNLFAKDLVPRSSEADRSRRVEERVKEGERARAGKKGEECGKVRKEESVFPKKKSSRERSRLGLPSWRNTRSSLILSFSLLSSARLPTSNQLRTFAASAFQRLPVYLFFPLFSHPSCAYVLKKSVLSLPLSLLPNISTLSTTSISPTITLWHRDLYFCEYINCIFLFLFSLNNFLHSLSRDMNRRNLF